MEQEKNVKWENFRKREVAIECLLALVIIIFFIGGVVLDFSDYSVPVVDNLNDLSLTTLQIQASISAISIALLALIGGFISEEYNGISISDYYLNIRPFLFKQKTIICGLLVFDGCNLCFHIYKFYNLVIAIAWINCIVIIISALEIYEIFKGKKKIYEELDNYIDYMLFGKNVKIQKKCELFSGFVRAWAGVSLNTVDYEKNLHRYNNIIHTLLKEDAKNTLGVINEEAVNLIEYQIAILEKSKLYRAYEIFDQTYLSIWKYILENNCKSINADFNLYRDCVDEIITLIDNIDTEHLSSNVSWRRTTDNIIRVDIYCNHDDNMCLKMPDDNYLKMVTWFATSLGKSLSNRRKNNEVIESRRWGVEGSRYYFDSNIPVEIIDEYKLNQCKFEFAYYYSLLRNGMTDLVKTVFDDIKYRDKPSYEELLFLLLVFSYTYYIGEVEKIDCVSDDEKKNANMLLEMVSEKGIFVSIIYDISWNVSTENLKKIYEDLSKILNSYERLPINGDVKFCIMNSVVDDFFMLFISLVLGVCRREEIINSLINDQMAKHYYSRYFGDSTNGTKEKLIMIFKCFSNNISMEEVLIDGIEQVNSIVLNNYKEVLFSESEREYKDFLNIQSNNLLAENVKNKLNLCIKEWTVIPQKDYTRTRRVLLEGIIPVACIHEKGIELFNMNLEGCLLLNIIYDLKRSGRIKEYKKIDNNDDYYLDFLKCNNIEFIIGSDNIVNTVYYQKRKAFDKLIIDNDITRIPIGGVQTGLVLKEKIGVEILDVSISYSHVNISDVECEFNSKKGLYICPEVAGDLEFTKKELEDYLFKERVRIHISVKLNYEFKQTDLGFYINKINNDDFD